MEKALSRTDLVDDYSGVLTCERKAAASSFENADRLAI
jgi:hypothetical protein